MCRHQRSHSIETHSFVFIHPIIRLIPNVRYFLCHFGYCIWGNSIHIFVSHSFQLFQFRLHWNWNRLVKYKDENRSRELFIGWEIEHYNLWSSCWMWMFEWNCGVSVQTDETNDLFKQTIISPFELDEHDSRHVIAICLSFRSFFFSSCFTFSRSFTDSLTYRTNNICYEVFMAPFQMVPLILSPLVVLWDSLSSSVAVQPLSLMASQCVGLAKHIPYRTPHQARHKILLDCACFCEKWTHFYQASVHASLPSRLIL